MNQKVHRSVLFRNGNDCVILRSYYHKVNAYVSRLNQDGARMRAQSELPDLRLVCLSANENAVTDADDHGD